MKQQKNGSRQSKEGLGMFIFRNYESLAYSLHMMLEGFDYHMVYFHSNLAGEREKGAKQTLDVRL